MHFAACVAASPGQILSFTHRLLWYDMPDGAYGGLLIVICICVLLSIKTIRDYVKIVAISTAEVCCVLALMIMRVLYRWSRHMLCILASPILLIHVIFIRFGVYKYLKRRVPCFGWFDGWTDDNSYDSIDDRLACVVCMTLPKCMMMRPCNHLCLCSACAEVLRFV
jgi:hypothetical protein